MTLATEPRFLQRTLMQGQYTAGGVQPLGDASGCYMRNPMRQNDVERKARFLPPVGTVLASTA